MDTAESGSWEMEETLEMIREIPESTNIIMEMLEVVNSIATNLHL
jgi:hypothetical protein